MYHRFSYKDRYQSNWIIDFRPSKQPNLQSNAKSNRTYYDSFIHESVRTQTQIYRRRWIGFDWSWPRPTLTTGRPSSAEISSSVIPTKDDRKSQQYFQRIQFPWAWNLVKFFFPSTHQHIHSSVERQRRDCRHIRRHAATMCLTSEYTMKWAITSFLLPGLLLSHNSIPFHR